MYASRWVSSRFNFLQPEPGTAAGDHLASGLIPVAVLAAGDRDILAGVECLRDRPDIDPNRIGGFGFSVGREQVIAFSDRALLGRSDLPRTPNRVTSDSR